MSIATVLFAKEQDMKPSLSEELKVTPIRSRFRHLSRCPRGRTCFV
jgi:hypothetical protein